MSGPTPICQHRRQEMRKQASDEFCHRQSTPVQKGWRSFRFFSRDSHFRFTEMHENTHHHIHRTFHERKRHHRAVLHLLVLRNMFRGFRQVGLYVFRAVGLLSGHESQGLHRTTRQLPCPVSPSFWYGHYLVDLLFTINAYASCITRYFRVCTAQAECTG